VGNVKWIKIVIDIFDDEKILLIESLPDADAITVIWFKLLCLAGKINNGGVLMLNDKIAYTDEMLATIFRKPLNTVRLALNAFEGFGMVEIVNNVITIPNWSKHQSLDQLEARNEYMQKYMAGYREKQKLIASGDPVNLTSVNSKVNGKVNVNSLEEELEVERDIDKDIKEKTVVSAGAPTLVSNNKKPSIKEQIKSYTDNPDLREALEGFVEMRKKAKKALTERALGLQLTSLDKLAYNDQDKINIVNQSTANSWSSFYELKAPQQGKKPYVKPPAPKSEYSRIYDKILKP